MKKTPDQLNIEKTIKSDILSKFPLLGVTLNSSKFITSNKVETIETDGTDIIYNPSYIENIPFDKKVFEFSHNLMHIQFNHVARSKDKDLTTWNYSTDAVINQILKKEGISIEGIDIPDAVNKSAEEIYTQLMTAQQQNKSFGNNGNQSLNSKSSGKGDNGSPSPNHDNSQGNKKDNNTDSSSSAEQSNENSNNQNKTNSSNVSKKNNGEENQQNQDSQSQQASQSNNLNNLGNAQSNDDEFYQNYPENENPQGNGQSSSTSGQNGSGNISPDLLKDFEDYQNNGNSQQHSNWNGQAKKMNIFQKIMEMISKKQNEQPQQNEQQFISDNNHLKNEQLQQLTDYLENKKQSKDKKGSSSLQRLEESPTLEDFMDPIEQGYAPIVDWKKFLKRNKERRRDEKLEYTWTRRRANEDSYWQSRLERKKLLRVREEEEKKPITLVAIDTSPSISEELLKGFVNQFGELAKESRILVGCFYNHFCGYKELIPDENGKLYVHLERGWGTDLDSACRSFKNFEETHKDLKILNRVIFTDGDHSNGTKPYRDLQDTDCLWLVFDYPGQFSCCCGQVLQFNSKDLLKDIKKENSQPAKPKDDEMITLT